MKRKLNFFLLLVLMILSISFYSNIFADTASADAKSQDYDTFMKNCVGGNPAMAESCEKEWQGRDINNYNTVPNNDSSSENQTNTNNNAYSSCMDRCIKSGTEMSKCSSQCTGYRTDVGFDPSLLGNSDIDPKVKNVGKSISKTVFTLLQILSFIGIVVTGIKYMYSSADQKADIKKGIIYLIIGMILVFGASTVANFVVDSFDQTIGMNVK